MTWCRMPFRDFLRQSARRYAFPVVASCWAAGHALAGWLRPPGAPVRPWTARGTDSVVVVAPHPDDETLGAGGATLLHQRAGDTVTVVVVTDGRASHAGGLPPDEMARRRKGEMRQAAHCLGVANLVDLDLPEGEWQEGDARTPLARVLREARIVYVPSCVDFHPEHMKVAALTARLLQPHQTVRIYEIGVPLTPRLVNLIADIRSVDAVKQQALQAFVTQADALAAPARMARYRARRYRLPAAEVFWELPAAVYTRLMAENDWRGGKSPYRGIRSRPLTDPLSAWMGGVARRSLRAQADALVTALIEDAVNIP